MTDVLVLCSVCGDARIEPEDVTLIYGEFPTWTFTHCGALHERDVFGRIAEAVIIAMGAQVVDCRTLDRELEELTA